MEQKTAREREREKDKKRESGQQTKFRDRSERVILGITTLPMVRGMVEVNENAMENGRRTQVMWVGGRHVGKETLEVKSYDRGRNLELCYESEIQGFLVEGKDV